SDRITWTLFGWPTYAGSVPNPISRSIGPIERSACADAADAPTTTARAASAPTTASIRKRRDMHELLRWKTVGRPIGRRGLLPRRSATPGDRAAGGGDPRRSPRRDRDDRRRGSEPGVGEDIGHGVRRAQERADHHRDDEGDPDLDGRPDRQHVREVV